MVKLELDLRPNYPAGTYAEYEPGARAKFNDTELAGKTVELVVKCYTEEIDRYDLNVMKRHLRAKGAREVVTIIQLFEKGDN